MKSSRMHAVKHVFTIVAKRSMPQVMAEGYSFCQIFVKIEGSCYSSGYLRHFYGVCEPGPEMISFRS